MNEIREKYLNIITDIVKASEHHKPPFSIYTYESIYDKYLSILNSLDRKDRVEAENVLLEYAKSTIIVDYEIKNNILSKYEELNEKLCSSPSVKEFVYTPNITPPFTLKAHDVNGLISKYMANYFPRYSLDNEYIPKVPKEAIIYNELICEGVEAIIFFDMGSLASPRITPYIGIKNPSIYIEVGKLIRHPDWNPYDLDSAESMIAEIFNFLKDIYPLFVRNSNKDTQVKE